MASILYNRALVSTGKLIYRGTERAITGEMVLGRSKDCDVRVADKIASRQHAKVGTDGSAYWVEDLGSANGTRINGRRFKGRIKLNHGDRITIGQSHVVFQIDERNADSQPQRRAPQRPEALLGQMVAGYRITAILGQGAMGTVYRAKQLRLDREVALKVFRRDVLDADASFAERMIEEARLAGSLDHESIARVHECGREGEILWYSMELVSGDTLDDLIRRDRRLDTELALVVAEKVGRALQATHLRKIVHHDIKPGNIMITAGGQVKVLDLGLARVLQEGRQSTEKTAVVGTPSFMSPEQAMDQPTDQRTDIYSLGCTLYTMLAGTPPYRGRTALEIIKAHLEAPIPRISEARPGLPANLDDLLQGMLAKNPEWRFATMGECLEEIVAIRQTLRQGPATDPGPAVASRAGRTPIRSEARRSVNRRRRGNSSLYIGLAVAGVVIVATLVLVDRLNHRRRPPLDEEVTTTQVNDDSSGHTSDPDTVTDNSAEDPLAAWRERWSRLRERLAELKQDHQWSRAEFALRALRDDLPAHADDIHQDLALTLQELRLEADAWYQRAVVHLPPDGPATITERVIRLAEIRNKVLSRNRSDVEALYRSALSRLQRRVTAARRQAVRLMEKGRLKELPALAKDLADAFRGTPVAGLYRDFATQVREASHLDWRGTWPDTRLAMSEASDEQALAAGAALLLIGEREAAVDLLLKDPALERGQLLERRQDLLSSEAVMLDFDSPADLQQIRTDVGAVTLANGALVAASDEAVSLTCQVSIGGSDWEADIDLEARLQPGEHSQAVIAIGKERNTPFNLFIEPDGLRLLVDTADGRIEQTTPTPADHRLRLRLRLIDGLFKVVLGSETLLDGQRLTMPPGSHLRLDAVDVNWALHELRIIGGS